MFVLFGFGGDMVGRSGRLQDMDTKGMKSSIITYNPSIQKMECKES